MKDFDDGFDMEDDAEMAAMMNDLEPSLSQPSQLCMRAPTALKNGDTVEEKRNNVVTKGDEFVCKRSLHLEDEDVGVTIKAESVNEDVSMTTCISDDNNADEEIDELALLESLGDAFLGPSEADGECEPVLDMSVGLACAPGNENEIVSVDTCQRSAQARFLSTKENVRHGESSSNTNLNTSANTIRGTATSNENNNEGLADMSMEQYKAEYRRKVKKYEEEMDVLRKKLEDLHQRFQEECTARGCPLATSDKDSTTQERTYVPIVDAKPKVPFNYPRVDSGLLQKKRISAMSPEEEKIAEESRAISKAASKRKEVENEVYSGLKITERRFPAGWLESRMAGKKALRVSRSKEYFRSHKHETEDFIIIGVLESRKSTKDNKSDLWQIGDLEGNSVTILLKNSIKEELASEGYVRTAIVGIMNPKVLKKNNDHKNQLLIVEESKAIINLGICPDFAICKGRRKDGSKCTMTVNKSKCQYCNYHMISALKENSKKRPQMNGVATNQKFMTSEGSYRTSSQGQHLLPVRKQSISVPKSSFRTVGGDEEFTKAPTNPKKSIQNTVATSQGVDTAAKAVASLRGTIQFAQIGLVKKPENVDRLHGKKSADAAVRKLQGGGFGKCPITGKSRRDLLVEHQRGKEEAINKERILDKIKKFNPNGMMPVNTNTLAENLRRMQSNKPKKEMCPPASIASEKDSRVRTKRTTEQDGRHRSHVLQHVTDGAHIKKLKIVKENANTKPPKKEFGTMGADQLAELMSKKSINAKLYREEEKRMEDERDEPLIRKEQIYDRMANTKENKRTCQFCETCDKYYYQKEALCLRNRHSFRTETDCTIRYFKCSQCKKIVNTINKKMPDRCKHCRCTKLTRHGMIDHKTVKPGTDFLARGEEHGIVLGSAPVRDGVIHSKDFRVFSRVYFRDMNSFPGIGSI
eukprot:CFRG3479T1